MCESNHLNKPPAKFANSVSNGLVYCLLPLARCHNILTYRLFLLNPTSSPTLRSRLGYLTRTMLRYFVGSVPTLLISTNFLRFAAAEPPQTDVKLYIDL